MLDDVSMISRAERVAAPWGRSLMLRPAYIQSEPVGIGALMSVTMPSSRATIIEMVLTTEPGS